MHTFKGPGGVTFHYNSDMSGIVEVTDLHYVSTHAAGDVRVGIDGRDVMALLEHLRGDKQDRERIEFIRRAAIALRTSPEHVRGVEDVWAQAVALWNDKPEGM